MGVQKKHVWRISKIWKLGIIPHKASKHGQFLWFHDFASPMLPPSFQPHLKLQTSTQFKTSTFLTLKIYHTLLIQYHLLKEAMSSDSLPISPARFSSALKDLPLSTLHLKAAELRNSIAHLDYSNEQLQPFADGTDPSTNGEPDQVCLDAIKENEIVIARFEERIELLKKEVEERGCNVSFYLLIYIV